MELSQKKLKEVKEVALRELSDIEDAQSLESWRVKYLGRKGVVPVMLRQLKDLPLEMKSILGKEGNSLRSFLQLELEKASRRLMRTGAEEDLPESENRKSAVGFGRGHLHPLTLAIRRIQKIFTGMGFVMAEGPLAEDPSYAFDLLNIPLEHPARGMMDTFYLEGGQVLRPHTSPVQLRSVLEQDLKPPFRVFSPGRVFRSERTDASHQYTFYQVEALMVGRRVTVANFKWVVEKYFSEYFEQKVDIRLRPSYFPFVEPGFEVDMSCIFCQMKGCSVCQRSGWVEMMGAGMVHPNVLSNMNVDSQHFQGFAFGGGIERIDMPLRKIDDIRLYLSGDIKFLRQFS